MKIVVLHASGSDAVEELIPRSGDIYFVIYMSHIPQHADALIPTAGKIHLKIKIKYPQNHMGLWDMS